MTDRCVFGGEGDKGCAGGQTAASCVESPRRRTVPVKSIEEINELKIVDGDWQMLYQRIAICGVLYHNVYPFGFLAAFAFLFLHV